ncbi:isocitrate/isopropylmalate dehydrogenase family protein [Bacillota bacterium LX-D]|nr:isocitrate/isopropylmalate dehydrogenase family protein [Bacillota bacterium LX-D]
MAHNVTLIPGDGIGPEISAAAKKVIDATGVEINWEIVEAGEKVIAKEGTPLPQYVLDSIKKNKVALKGPLTTPIGTGFRSVNVALRKELNLYANLRPAKSLPNVLSRYTDIDLVIVRENTEDLYAGIEHMVGEDAAESIKIITRKASERIVKYAFEYAVREGRKKVTAVHKANIMKCTDGLFLAIAREVAQKYPQIQFEDKIVDNMCMQLVQRPEAFDVLVLPNLYGDIVSDLCAGLVGGLGLAPGANIGEEYAVFEPVHGSAPDIAGQNKSNPLAILMSGILMLEHLGEQAAARNIMEAIKAVLTEKISLTGDLGGNATTDQLADAIISKLQ